MQQRMFQSRKDVVRDVNVFEDWGQAFCEVFFTHVGQSALPAIACAVVVGITVFLEFRCNHAVVIGTLQQTAKGKLMSALFRFVVPQEYSLDLIKEILAEQRCMSSGI